MLQNLKAQPADKILTLMAAYREDPRDTKVDLGVGVYKDASGNTPVMRAVKGRKAPAKRANDKGLCRPCRRSCVFGCDD